MYGRNQDSNGTKAGTSYVETDPTGRYGRLDEVLGRGAMKTVYKAIDELLGLEVAWNQVKLNELMRSPDDMQRLYSEVHLLSTLKHDSIIRFHTSWIDVDRKSFNFITEMFTSGTLREYRSKYKRVDIRAIKDWARQILQGIIYLHSHDPPVIHRDLKCDNIFVNGHLGKVKIGDLGLAAILRGAKSAHSVIGTPEFMAPELYEEDYNELVDVYSFGMCLLEMITCEYPYGECTNPAQIYKKVSSGKLPAAFYRIRDFEAQRFIGKCLVKASKRLSAKELLLDPFLSSDEVRSCSTAKMIQKPFLNEKEILEKLRLSDDDSPRTDMTITGKLNPEDDTIFLKVQIADKDGPVRNVYFPFDILHDTPLDVAIEMVKELEISEWEPFEIAEMIDGEISALIPRWKHSHFPYSESYHTFNYEDGDDEPHHPFYSNSPCSSSHASLSGLRRTTNGFDSLYDDLYDDTSSQSSSYSGKYSNMNYVCNDESKPNPAPTGGDPHDHDHHQHLKQCLVPKPRCHSTRFRPEDYSNTVHSIPTPYYKHYHKVLLESYGASPSSRSRGKKGVVKGQKFVRNHSLVDVRSQLLHRSLVEEVHKRRVFNTVGAVENIGFQAPCEAPKKVPSRRSSKQKAVKS